MSYAVVSFVRNDAIHTSVCQRRPDAERSVLTNLINFWNKALTHNRGKLSGEREFRMRITIRKSKRTCDGGCVT